MEVANRRMVTWLMVNGYTMVTWLMYTQMYSNQNKEGIFIATKLCFYNWSGGHGWCYNHVLPLAISYSVCLQQAPWLFMVICLAWWPIPSFLNGLVISHPARIGYSFPVSLITGHGSTKKMPPGDMHSRHLPPSSTFVQYSRNLIST